MFRVGYLQFSPVRCDVEKNIVLINGLLSGVQADLLVMPELSNSGYLYKDSTELAPFAEAGDGSGPFLIAMQSIAARIGGVIVTGFAEKTIDGLYNSAAAIDGKGIVQIYRKTHLFSDEMNLFIPGDTGFKIFEYKGFKIGMMICFDWIFPESARTLALRGAQIITHPANLVLPFCQQAMVTRSLENGVFTITANRFGQETLDGKKLVFTGNSQIIDVKGNRILQSPTHADEVRICEIEPSLAENKFITKTNHLFKDRHPEMYA